MTALPLIVEDVVDDAEDPAVDPTALMPTETSMEDVLAEAESLINEIEQQVQEEEASFATPRRESIPSAVGESQLDQLISPMFSPEFGREPHEEVDFFADVVPEEDQEEDDDPNEEEEEEEEEEPATPSASTFMPDFMQEQLRRATAHVRDPSQLRAAIKTGYQAVLTGATAASQEVNVDMFKAELSKFLQGSSLPPNVTGRRRKPQLRPAPVPAAVPPLAPGPMPAEDKCPCQSLSRPTLERRGSL